MKTAFITGANRGLGYGFVQYLLNEGYMVFAGTRTISKDLPQQEHLFWIEIDVTNDDSITRAFTFVAEKTSSLDLLINNAGVNKDTQQHSAASVSDLNYIERTALLEMIDINAVSPLMVTKKFFPLLTTAPSFIINISSCRASFHDEFENVTGNYGYRASKIALNMFTFCSVFDLPEHIQTFAVHPGNVKSDMNPQGTNEPIQRAEKILAIVKHWKKEWNGKFMRHDGTPYPL